MAGTLQKRISKLLTKPLRRSASFASEAYNDTKQGKSSSSSSSSHNKALPRSITIVCTPDHSTQDILWQLQQASQDRHVTNIVLQEMIQRPDNVPLFSKIQDLLRSSSKSCFGGVTSIHLLEPHVLYTDYRRWSYKRTNLLHRVRKDAKERHIEITVQGTLIFDQSNGMDNNDNPEQDQQQNQQHQLQPQPQHLSQNLASWLSLIQHLPHDPDITSLHISLREEPIVCMVEATSGGRRRPSQLDLLQSPVQKVFQALIELFNSDTRQWAFIRCHVQYRTNDHQTLAHLQQQTQSLLDVAELFHIPLQVQWQPLDGGSSSCNLGGTATRIITSSSARHLLPSASSTLSTAAAAQGAVIKYDDDNTSETFESSGAFVLMNG